MLGEEERYKNRAQNGSIPASPVRTTPAFRYRKSDRRKIAALLAEANRVRKGKSCSSRSAWPFLPYGAMATATVEYAGTEIVAV
jgi:hypothetical protein